MAAQQTVRKVALAGATGNVGAPMLKALLDEGFEVTVFTRPDSNHSFSSGVNVVKTDYKDTSALTKALQGHDAVISTITTAAVDAQKPLIDAAIAAGVKRFIPSEFGSNLSNPKSRALPVFGGKVAVQQLVEESTKGTQTTYTYIYNNAFMDKSVFSGLLMDVKGKKMEFIDGGETTFTITPLDQIAKGTVAVLKHLDETANRVVKLHGLAITQKQLFDVAQDVLGKDGWTITETTTDAEEQNSWAALKSDPSNVMAWIFGFLKVAVYKSGYGGDLSKENDNALLGLKGASIQDLERAIKETESS